MAYPRSYSVLALSLFLLHPVSEVFGQAPPPAASGLEAVAAVDAPYYISFQGFLEDDGSPADGSYNIQFRFMNLASLGSALWTETHSTVQVADGVYNVLFGSVSTLANQDFDDDLWLSIKVNGGNEILPRARIVGTPYSFLAFEALDVRLPAQISGSTQLQGQELLKITQNGVAGDVLEIDGGGTASTGISVHSVDLAGITAGAEFGPAFFGSGSVTGFKSQGNDDGFVSSGAGDDAFVINSAGNDGLHVVNVTDDAINILNAGDDAIFITDAGDDAIYISDAGDDAIYISNATDDGILVTGVGGHAFNFQDVPTTSTGNLLSAYVGIIENTSTGSSADALAIQIETTGNPGTAANFVGFFDGDDDLIGQIEGNGSGGVAYNTTGSDYAEYLPHSGAGQAYSAGDVVGVFNGHISHRTEGAHQIMVITDQAAVLGNTPSGMDDAPGHEAIGFIGQVRVRVDGRVNEGDYIVASGRNDGLGVAVGPASITLDHVSQLAGRAWESSEERGVHRVNIVVGLDRTEVLEAVIRRQNERFESQQQTLDDLRRVLEAHVREHAGS
jgi:hypothetical protein